MILLLTVLSVVAFAFTNIFAKKTWQTFLSVIFAGVFILSLGLIVANDQYHYGMKKETVTTTKTLKSSSPNSPVNMLLYQPLGNGTEKIYLYKTNESQKKLSQTGTDKVTNKVNEHAANNQIVTKKIRWVYQNDTMKTLFGLTSKNKEKIKEINTFDVSDNWLVLSTTQAKKLAKQVEENQANMQTEAQAFVTDRIKTALMANPSLTADQQKQIQAEATAEYQQQAIAKLVTEIK
ncbi:DUF4811 domain-containing protein [Enterococcus sp. AZ103]|uniref:DUF4811 domain-containing protein n=1 Tax=Enterococcus sp. AZ103 TaxID=2774628 RepID=UPI003F2302EE